MNDLPMLSVIIPAYNAEQYLKEAVDSVRNQNWNGACELIVADDGSTDRTAELAAQLGCRVVSRSNSGAAAARNAGIRQAAGELFFFLDADDVLMPGSFSALFAPMEKDPALMAVFGTYIDFISPDLSGEEAEKLRADGEERGGRLTGCALLKKEVFARVGLFDASLRTGETVEWMMRFRDAKEACLQTETLTLKRRLHRTNTGRVDPKGEMMSYAALLRKRMKKK